jgi:hypothetical protein
MTTADLILLSLLGEELEEELPPPGWLPPPPRVPAFAAETVRPGRSS